MALNLLNYKEVREKMGRFDLHLNSYEPLSKTAAKVIFTYSDVPPNRQDFERFISSHFPNVRVVKGSMIYDVNRLGRPNGAIACVMAQVQTTRPVSDGRKLACVTAETFSDGNNLWKITVKDGKKFLVREAETDIESLILERKKRLGIKVASLGFVPYVLNSGDRVKFYGEGKMQEGVVEEVTANDVTVRVADRSITTNRKNVVTVVAYSPEAIERKRQQLQSFWQQAYGFTPDMAEKITRGIGR